MQKVINNDNETDDIPSATEYVNALKVIVVMYKDSKFKMPVSHFTSLELQIEVIAQ